MKFQFFFSKLGQGKKKQGLINKRRQINTSSKVTS